MKPGPGHANNRERMLVDLNNTAHHATVILKMGMPIRIAEHDIGGAVRAALIGCMEETAKIRLNT